MNTYVNALYPDPISAIQPIMIMLFRYTDFMKIDPNTFTLMPLKIYLVPPEPIPRSIHQPHSNHAPLIDLKHPMMS